MFKRKGSGHADLGRVALLALALSACSRGHAAPGQPEAASSTSIAAAAREGPSYLARLVAFKTKLVRRGPAPQTFAPERPPTAVHEVRYTSDGLELKAWVAYPPGASPSAKVPGIAYFHGGFAFGADDFASARPFLNAGLAVICPMLRGENGNPGDSEMYLGEVRDAKAAVLWLASQPSVDASHIYTFGHSAGGIVSSLLSLHELPIRHGGSAGAMCGPALFDGMSKQVPFALDDPNERQVRLLLGNTQWMRHPHYAFLGSEDGYQAAKQAQSAAAANKLLSVATVPGNHFTSLGPAVTDYLKVIKAFP